MATEKIIVQIGDEIQELKGVEKDAYIAQREEDNAQFQLVANEMKAKQDSRDSALKKLADIAGLTKEELASIL
jgi:hypothetical protein